MKFSIQSIFTLSQCDSQKRSLAESCSHLWPGHIQEKPVLVFRAACTALTRGSLPPPLLCPCSHPASLSLMIIRALLTPVVYEKELKAYKMKSQMEPSDNRSKAQIAKGWHIYHHHLKPPCAHTGSPLCVWRQLGFSVPKQRWLRVCTAPGAGGTWLWLPEMLLTCAVPCRCVAMSLSNTGQNQPN